MPDIHIEREHGLGLAAARKIAFQWAEQAEAEFAMQCSYAEGRTDDLLSFERSGVSGTLKVDKSRFELDASLGFLLGAFKGRIESQIVEHLDALLAKKAKVSPRLSAKVGAKTATVRKSKA